MSERLTSTMIIIMSLMMASVLLINTELTAAYLILHKASQSLHLSVAQLSWVIMLYMLAFSSIMVVGGRTGDLFGHQRILLLGLAVFVFGSLLGGLANHLSYLLIGRFLQGVGAALAWPNTTTIAFSTFPQSRKGLSVGLLTAFVGVTLAAGPLIGGFFATYLSWRWLFLINVPLGIILALLIHVNVPNKVTAKATNIDWLGSLTLIITLACLCFALNQLPHASMRTIVIIVFIISLIFGGAFIFVENKSHNPILPTVLIKNKQFINSCLLRFLTVIPLYTTLLVMSLYLQKHLHLSAFKSGLVFLPMTAVIALLSSTAGSMVDRFGAKLVMRLGIIGSITGCLLLTLLLAKLNPVAMALVLIFLGLGFTLVSPAAVTLSLQAASDETKGAASGVYFMASVMGGLFAVCISTSIIEFFTKTPHALTRSLIDIFIFCILASVIALLRSQKIKKITAEISSS